MSDATLNAILRIIVLVAFGCLPVSQLVTALRTGVISWARAKYPDATGQRSGFLIDREGVPLSSWFLFTVLAGMAAVSFGAAAVFAWALVFGA